MVKTILRVSLFIILTTAVCASAMADSDTDENPGDKKWEYLVVGAASNTNQQPTSYTAMRKDTSGAFGREPFVLEQQLDKLGAKGWELVSVVGPPNNFTYYFKRIKR